MTSFGVYVEHQGEVEQAKLLIDSLTTCIRPHEIDRYMVMTPLHQHIHLDQLEPYRVDFELPPSYQTIPFVDKVWAAAEFEGLCQGPYLWSDIDACFVKPFSLPPSPDLLINPVDIKNIGDDYLSARSEMWQILNNYFQISPQSPVSTTVTNEVIYPYYNLGMLLVNRPKSVFSKARNAMINLLSDTDIQRILSTTKRNAVFFHQAVMTCAILSQYDVNAISPLPMGLNYPLHLHDQAKAPLPLEQLISFRYEDYFESHGVPKMWASVIGDTFAHHLNPKDQGT